MTPASPWPAPCPRSAPRSSGRPSSTPASTCSSSAARPCRPSTSPSRRRAAQPQALHLRARRAGHRRRLRPATPAALHLMRTGAAGVLVGFGGGAAHTTRLTLGHPRPDGLGDRRRRRGPARLHGRVRRPLRARHRRRRHGPQRRHHQGRGLRRRRGDARRGRSPGPPTHPAAATTGAPRRTTASCPAASGSRSARWARWRRSCSARARRGRHDQPHRRPEARDGHDRLLRRSRSSSGSRSSSPRTSAAEQPSRRTGAAEQPYRRSWAAVLLVTCRPRHRRRTPHLGPEPQVFFPCDTGVTGGS